MSYLTAWIPGHRLPTLAKKLRAQGFEVSGRGLRDQGTNGAYVANVLEKLGHDPQAARLVRDFLCTE